MPPLLLLLQRQQRSEMMKSEGLLKDHQGPGPRLLLCVCVLSSLFKFAKLQSLARRKYNLTNGFAYWYSHWHKDEAES